MRMPVTVAVSVMAGVVVGLATVPAKPFALATLRVVTVPAAEAGVAHVPSPRQKVVDDALVPEFRFVTGRLPVTPVVSGSPVRLVATPLAGVPRAGVVSVGLVSVLFVRVCVAASVTTVSDAPGNVNVVPSVPLKPSELFSVSVLLVVPPATEKPVAFAVRVRPFTLVAVRVVNAPVLGAVPPMAGGLAR